VNFAFVSSQPTYTITITWTDTGTTNAGTYELTVQT
jgi:hypothetical protein